MDCGIAVDLAGRGLKDRGLHSFGEAQHIDRPVHRCLGGLHRIELVVDRDGYRRPETGRARRGGRRRDDARRQARVNLQSSLASTNEERRAISDRQAVPFGGPPMT